ncbi:FecCD family ABC transporter permease [Thermoflavimicrobium daqui]|nr:iron ABC transporter permease [Thermoflavimicrobium daqui]
MALFLFAGITFVSVTLAVMLGPVKITPLTVWKIILSHFPMIGGMVEQDWSQAQDYIVWNIRLPRVLLGVVIGSGLAIVGTVIQALVRNSLADPYILGVSSGASVAATLVIIFGALPLFGQYALSIGSFLGALLSMIMVYILAQTSGRVNNTRLLLSGIAVSMVLSAITNLIVTMAPNEQGIRDAMFWMMGSLAGAKWEYLTIPSFVVLFGLFFLLFQYRSLNALLMGEETATTLGINTDTFRKVLILISSLVTGVIVAVSGAIGFIGLMVPHITRFLIGSDHRRVLPISAFLGAIITIWADVLARLIFAPQELPIGVVTAMCGGPFFIWLLRRQTYSFGGANR